MNIKLLYLVPFIIFTFTNNYSFTPDFIVSKDGTGDFSSIQDALTTIPSASERQYIIYIKSGTYNERIFIEKSNIVLVGENKDNTRIAFAELRKNWRAEHPDDYGSAVVNIKNDVTDIIFINLTIHNNYGGLFGDNDHQFAIRGGEGVTRIIIDNCNIIADGGDTVSLWNTNDGMYYHSNSYFEGYADYVCPRGYCYIENSKFYGHSLTASIWHDGSAKEDHKFVIKNSSFDGVAGFSLGRFHRDAQFFLIDCVFSDNMADRKIYFAPSNPPRILQWGEGRTYFYNCSGEKVDYDWHKDNFKFIESFPSPEEISALWTFNYKWDPESILKSLYEKN